MTVFSSLLFLQETGNKLAISQQWANVNNFNIFQMKKIREREYLSVGGFTLWRSLEWNETTKKINQILIRREKKIKKFRWQKSISFRLCCFSTPYEWTCDTESLNRVNRGIHSS